MAIPAVRIDDKVQATRFTAFGGLVISVEPCYCDVGTAAVPQVELSPVIQVTLSTRRLCLGNDVSLDITNSYSPFRALATYSVDWGDGTAPDAGAWAPGVLTHGSVGGDFPTAQTYMITITIVDNAPGGVGGPFTTTIYEYVDVIDCTLFPFDGWCGLDGGGVYRVTSPWIARNAGLAGDWLTVYDIDLNHPGQMWISTAAGVAVSIDEGASWRKLPLEDPADTWGIGITAALLNYTMIARDHCNPDKCYIIAEYDSNPGNDEWVGYLLYTDDNFDSWTWKPLGGAYQALGAWGYVQQIPSFFTAEGDQLVSVSSVLVNPVNATGVPNGQYGGFAKAYVTRTGALGHDYLYDIILDLGCYIELDAGTVSGGINIEIIVGAHTDTMTYAANEPDIWLLASPGGVDYEVIRTWDGAVDGYPVAALPATKSGNPTINNRPFRHMKIRHVSAAYTGSGTCRMLIDGIRVWPDVVYKWIRPYAISVDKLTGRYLYMSLWNGRNNQLLVWDTEDMTTWINERRISGLVVAAPVYRQAKALSPKWLDAEVSGYQTLVWGTLGGAGTGIQIMPAIEYGTPFSKYGYPVVGLQSGDITPAGGQAYDGYGEWPYELEMYIGKSHVVYRTVDAGVNWANYSGNLGNDANFRQPPQVEGFLNLDYVGEFIAGNVDLTAGDATRITYSMDDGTTYDDVSAGLPATDVRVVRLSSEF